MSQERLQMPSSGGGLVRYFEDAKSKIVFSPWVVVVAIAVIVVIEILLYKGVI